MYKLTYNGLILRLSDQTFIPQSPDNRDYQEYLEWVNGGNVAEDPDPLPSIPNWKQLENSLRNTPLWAKVFQASTLSLKAQSAYNLLYGSLTTTHNLDDFRFSITFLRASMSEIVEIGDFTTEEISTINALLFNSNFDIVLE